MWRQITDAAVTLAQAAEFQRYGKKTRRGTFSGRDGSRDALSELLALVAPHYSKGETGRKPVGLEIMLRFISCSSGLRCRTLALKMPCTESPVLRRFVGIDLGRARHRMRRRS